MRLAILGATGGIGRLLISNALEHDHDVIAFARSPEKISQSHPRLRVIGGDLYDIPQLTAAIRDSEAVVCAFGPTTLRKTTLRRDFGRALAQSLRKMTTPRVLIVSSGLIFPSSRPLAVFLRTTIFRNVVRDLAAMERELMQPGLAWTIVRPPRLLDKPWTGRTRMNIDRLPDGAATIARADVAHFMLEEAVARRCVHQIVGISE